MAVNNGGSVIAADLLALLRCPLDKGALSARDSATLSCDHGHLFPVLDGIPNLLVKGETPTIAHCHASLKRSTAPHDAQPINGIDPFVQGAVAATCGFMYRDLIGKLRRYPFQPLDLSPRQSGDLFLDIGCNWGRWSLVAAQKGFMPVGLDPELDAVFAARRIARQLGLKAFFVVGDARHLPFESGQFHAVHSYAVLQHLAKDDARLALKEAGRVLAGNGQALIQMPHKYGPRALMIQALRGFSDTLSPDSFELRYWTRKELLHTFQTLLGPTRLEFDGFFFTSAGRAVPPELPWRYRFLLHLSRLAGRLAFLARFADSFYLRTERRSE